MKASERKCCVCGKQAVAFYPCIDPDIPSHPYCQECLDNAKLELAVALWGDNEKMLNIAKGVIEYEKERRKGKTDEKKGKC